MTAITMSPLLLCLHKMCHVCRKRIKYTLPESMQQELSCSVWTAHILQPVLETIIILINVYHVVSTMLYAFVASYIAVIVLCFTFCYLLFVSCSLRKTLTTRCNIRNLKSKEPNTRTNGKNTHNGRIQHTEQKIQEYNNTIKIYIHLVQGCLFLRCFVCF